MTNTIRQDVNILGTLSAQGISPELVNKILGNVYRVGAIYISTDSTSPASLFGGTWERIQDKFLLASGSTYSPGTSGGSADAVLVEHNHAISGYAFQDASGTNNLSASMYGGEYKGNPFAYTSTQGESGIGKNMPPYLAVYMWKKVED